MTGCQLCFPGTYKKKGVCTFIFSSYSSVECERTSCPCWGFVFSYSLLIECVKMHLRRVNKLLSVVTSDEKAKAVDMHEHKALFGEVCLPLWPFHYQYQLQHRPQKSSISRPNSVFSFCPEGSLYQNKTQCVCRGVRGEANQPSRNKHSESLHMLFYSGGIYRTEVSSEILFKCVTLLFTGSCKDEEWR